MEEQMERLQKYMAAAGVASRRKCEELILEGKVKVNGQTVKELGVKIDPKQDVVTVNGKVLREEKHITILMNKPKEYITTVKDQFDRPTVMDLLKEDVKVRVYPVGRLDYNTEGLLLLTNDGELANKLTHPSFEIEKVYDVLVKGIVKEEHILALRKGVLLEDGMTYPAKVKVIDNEKGNTKIEITIHEGRNRQVRRMFAALGYQVIKLKRIRYGFLTLKGVSKGSYRYLTDREVKELKHPSKDSGKKRDDARPIQRGYRAKQTKRQKTSKEA